MYDQEESELEKTFIEGNIAHRSFLPKSPSQENISSNSPQIITLPDGEQPIQLGSGTVAGILGTGGMAKVFRIWNEKLEVFRAVKILLPNFQNDLKTRFETEAKITAKLHHPNIIEIYGIGEWNGLPYLEMEYVEGISLQQFVVKYGKLPEQVCSSIAICIAQALLYAHCREVQIYGNSVLS